MDAVDFEKYCFLRLYAIDLDTALHTIKVLRRYKRADVQYSLLRDIAVTYARPFSGNEGDKIPNHRLQKKHIPIRLKHLHEELVRLRKEQFAHTDLKFHRPKVAKFPGTAKPWFPMAFRNYNYDNLLSQLSEIEELIRDVERSIQFELATYEGAL